MQSGDAVKVITVRTTGFDAAAATGGSAAVETAAATADAGKSSYAGSEIAKSDRPELTAAKIIVSGGRALGSKEKFDEVKFDEVITPPSRQAGCGHRCIARRRGRGLPNAPGRVYPGLTPNFWMVQQPITKEYTGLIRSFGLQGALERIETGTRKLFAEHDD